MKLNDVHATTHVPQPELPPQAISGEVLLEKYAKGIPDIGYTPESASKEYSQPIRIQLVSVRSW